MSRKSVKSMDRDQVKKKLTELRDDPRVEIIRKQQEDEDKSTLTFKFKGQYYKTTRTEYDVSNKLLDDVNIK